jgi:hypothetical protein
VLALPDDASLSPTERFALELLADLSSVLRFDGAADVVRVVVAGEARPVGLAELRADHWGLVVGDGVVTVDRALLNFVAAVSCALSEQRTDDADRFGRVPSASTAPVQMGCEREPVVSIAACALATAVRAAAGRRRLCLIDPWPDGRRWAAALSHDLDVVQWWPAFTLLRLTELIAHGELSRAARVAASALRSVASPVVWRAIEGLLAIEARHAVRSTWFVLCGLPTLATARAGDLTYHPESAAARRILDAVRAAGHEIGLHGSFATTDDHAQFAAQRARLASLTHAPVSGVRQHYLRMRPDTTPRGMASAGFAYDSTVGYADRNGFRLGVADVLPLWDAERDAHMGIDEAPFVWMDRALSKYQHVEDPNVWIDDALTRADRCREVAGLWVGIWHPNLDTALGFPDATAAYARLVAELVARAPYVAPIGELVEWRRARRALRASAIAPDGRVALSGDDARRFTIRDGDGRAQSADTRG